MKRAARSRSYPLAGAAWLGLAGLAGCNALWGLGDLSYSAAGGAGGGGPSGGSGGSCVPDCGTSQCGDDGCNGSCGSCADDEICSADGVCCPGTWVYQLESDARRVQLWPETGSLYAATRYDGLYRLRMCDGQPVADSIQAKLGETFETRVIARAGDELWVAGNDEPHGLVHRLDPVSLEPLAAPEQLPTGPGDGLLHGGLGPLGALWLGLDTDGGGIVQYQPGETTCRWDFVTGTDDGFSRGFTVTAAGVLVGAWVQNDHVTLGYVEIGDCDPSAPCLCNAIVSQVALPGVFEGQRLTSYGDAIIAAGFAEHDFQSNLSSARVVRLDHGDLLTLQSYTYELFAGKMEGFTAVATNGVHIYAAGGQDGTVLPEVTGDALVMALSLQLETPPIYLATLPEAAIFWDLAVGDDGVYLAGLLDDGQSGFVMKCSLDLDCPSL